MAPASPAHPAPRRVEGLPPGATSRCGRCAASRSTSGPASFLAIVGHRGSGKSTCMNLIGCLDQPTRAPIAGRRRPSRPLPQQARAIRNRRIGLVFPELQPARADDGLENVALPMIYANVPFAEQRARRASCSRPSACAAASTPAEPASGRAAAARRDRAALANAPSVLLADEPTGNLDTASRASRSFELFVRAPLAAARHDHPGHPRSPTSPIHERVVAFSDGGRIVSDLPQAAVTARTEARAGMNLSLDDGRHALRALRRNVLAPPSTMLGVIIGVPRVTMVSIGRGANAAVQQEIQSLGKQPE